MKRDQQEGRKEGSDDELHCFYEFVLLELERTLTTV